VFASSFDQASKRKRSKQGSKQAVIDKQGKFYFIFCKLFHQVRLCLQLMHRATRSRLCRHLRSDDFVSTLSFKIKQTIIDQAIGRKDFHLSEGKGNFASSHLRV